MFWPFAIYAVILFFMAWSDAIAIKHDDPVNHPLNGLVHLLVAALFAIAIHPLAIIASLLEARLVFDLSLNLLRFGWKGALYVSLKPDSKVDQVEKKLFGGNGLVPKIVYAVLFATVLFLLRNRVA